MNAISNLFDSTVFLLPLHPQNSKGEIPLNCKNSIVIPLSKPFGKGIVRKLFIPFWFIFNLPKTIFHTLKSDVVHAPVPGDVGTVGILISILFRKKLIIRYCGNWLNIKTNTEKFLKWLMENLSGKNYILLATGGDNNPPSDKNQNIKWIFSSSFSNNKFKNNFIPKELDKSDIKLILVGRQEIGKGTDILLKSTKILLEKNYCIKVSIVGDGTALNGFKKLADELNVSENVKFLGKLNNDEVMKAFENSDLFCFPTSSEGFPKVVVESLSCGVPVIASNVSVIPNILNQECGLILKDINESELSDKIEFLINNPEIYSRYSKNGYEISQNYTLEKWAEFIKLQMDIKWK